MAQAGVAQAGVAQAGVARGAVGPEADAAHLVGWRRLQLQYEVGAPLRWTPATQLDPCNSWTPATQLGRCSLCGGVFG